MLKLYFMREKGYTKNYGDRMNVTLSKLTKDRMYTIEKEAELITDNLDFQNSPFVDITSLVQRDGFIVIPKLLDFNTAGVIHVNESNTAKKIKEIIVNIDIKKVSGEDDVIFKKCRFIAAHVYAHYKLHMPSRSDFYVHRDTDKRESEQELEADFYARSILMPKNEFVDYLHIAQEFSNGENDFVLKSLSKLFGVTTKKINERIEDMKILGYM